MSETLTIKPKQSEKKLQFINSLYYKPFYNKECKQLYGDDMNDFLVIIYRNEETDEKKLKIMPNPSIQFFVANDDIEINEPHLNQIELDKVHLEKVKYKHLLRYLARLQSEYTGENIDFTKYYRNGKDERKGMLYEANKFQLFNRVFASDINIEDYWKGRFLDTYPNASNTKITKAYTDIEVDSINLNGFPNPEDAACPINAITVFFEEQMQFYTLLLRECERENPKIAVLEEKNNKAKFIKKLNKEFGDEFKFKLMWFDDEMELIETYFNLLDKYKPDFNLIWNMAFDCNYILNRIGELNGFSRFDRETGRKYEWKDCCARICSSPEFPDYLCVAEYIPDKQNQKPADRIDIFRCASFTQWIDQLCLYASIRKGMGELESLALSYVSQKELGDDKLNYMESGSNIKTLPYDDYEMFVMYNIKDVLLLYKLEKKNNDIGLLNSISEITKTRLNKSMRKTVSLKNMAHHFYIDQGYAMGNNFNMTFGDGGTEPTEKFEGRMCALIKIF